MRNKPLENFYPEKLWSLENGSCAEYEKSYKDKEHRKLSVQQCAERIVFVECWMRKDRVFGPTVSKISTIERMLCASRYLLKKILEKMIRLFLVVLTDHR